VSEVVAIVQELIASSHICDRDACGAAYKR